MIAEWIILRCSDEDILIRSVIVPMGSTRLHFTGPGVDLDFVPSDPLTYEPVPAGGIGELWHARPTPPRALVLLAGRMQCARK